jgi:hypothetical protein
VAPAPPLAAALNRFKIRLNQLKIGLNWFRASESLKFVGFQQFQSKNGLWTVQGGATFAGASIELSGVFLLLDQY